MRAVIPLLLVVACTDVDIYIPFDPESAQLRLEVAAEVCAPPPLEEDVPYKILFVVDKSLSNLATDADERRVTAYQNAVQTFIAYPTVSFGVVLFNDYAHQPTLVFTRDLEILVAVGESMSNALAEGGTNYEDAITRAYDMILTDINATGDPSLVAKTHYIIYWLSDGLPTFGITDRHTLTSNVAAMAEYLNDKVAEFSLNTLYMEPPADHPLFVVSEEEIAEAQALLEEMALAGDGEFDNIATDQQFDFEITVERDVRPFELANLAVSNRHVLFGAYTPRADSDGDGLADEDEEELGLDSVNPDTDGDGWGDGLEHADPVQRPDNWEPGCDDPDADADGDTLNDCEELLAGTDPLSADTDRDGLPDGLEARSTSSPLSADRTADRDLDELGDFTELVIHLDPDERNTSDDRDRWGYRYNKRGQDAACVRVDVENIALYQTRVTDSHPRGGQTIEVWAAFRTANPADPVQLLKAEARAGFFWPDVREPADGWLEVEPDDFVALPLHDHEPPAGVEPPLEDPVTDPPAGNEPLAPASSPASSSLATGESEARPIELEWSGGCRATGSPIAWLLALALGRRRKDG